MAIVCLQCGKDDKVEPVGVVYSRGVVKTRASVTENPNLIDVLFSDKPKPTTSFTVEQTSHTPLIELCKSNGTALLPRQVRRVNA